MAYDIIGDIHGQADKLHGLLQALDYRETCGAWRHPCRTANPQKPIAQKAADKAKTNAELKRLQLKKKRSDAAKKAHETIKKKKAAVVAAAK